MSIFILRPLFLIAQFTFFFALPAMAAITERVSVDMMGKEGSQFSIEPSISGNGRFIAFASYSGNLVPKNNLTVIDIFVHDRGSRKVTRVSVSSAGKEANAHSSSPAISDDGAVIIFQSIATNLVAGDTNKKTDIFLHDLSTRITKRISLASNGKEGNGDSTKPSISPDGRYVVFASEANNLVSNDNNNKSDIFLYDRQKKKLALISKTPGNIAGNGDSLFPSISNNGKLIAFQSEASDLIYKDTNKKKDIFVYETALGRMKRISEIPSGPVKLVSNPGGNDHSFFPSISANGGFVSFESDATNLVQSDLNGSMDVFRHDLSTGITTQVSTNAKGWGGDRGSSFSSISRDGRFVAFESRASNLLPNVSSDYSDIFIYDHQTKKLSIASASSSKAFGNNFSFSPSISDDGKYVAYQSLADNLVKADNNYAQDIFMHGVINRAEPRKPYDYNGDGISDIFWRDPKTGKNAIWFLKNYKVWAAGWVPSVPAQWTPSIADFDGDLKADIFWHNTKTDVNILWFMDGNMVKNWEPFPPIPKPWKLAGFGDFNGDEKADMLWYNEKDGRSFIALMDGGTIIYADWLTTFNRAFRKIGGLGDFNGDGKTDILWLDKNGDSYIWFMYSVRKLRSSFVATTTNLQMFGGGDFNGDSFTDILWNKPGSGFYSMMYLDGAKVLNWIKPPVMGNAALVGDFNGDGISNILWRSKKGENHIWFNATGAAIPFRYLYNFDLSWIVVR